MQGQCSGRRSVKGRDRQWTGRDRGRIRGGGTERAGQKLGWGSGRSRVKGWVKESTGMGGVRKGQGQGQGQGWGRSKCRGRDRGRGKGKGRDRDRDRK